MAANTAMQMPNLRFPTGYEGEQRKIEMRRKLAQALLEKGLTNDPHMTNWTQVAGQLANAFAGKRMEKKATQREGEMYDKMRSDLADKMARLQQMRGSGAGNQAITDAFAGDPTMQDIVKPYADAYGSGLKNAEDLVEAGGHYVRKGDFSGPSGKVIPPKPTDMVINVKDPTTGQESWNVNPVAMSARLGSSPMPPGATMGSPLVQSMPNPYANSQAAPPPAGGPMPAQAPAAPTGGMDFSNFKPEEMNVLKQEIGRRAGLAPQAQNFPQGNPLSPPPSKVGPDGKPYWSVGGKWYDNPEGR